MKSKPNRARRQFLRTISIAAGGLLVSGGGASLLSGCSDAPAKKKQNSMSTRPPINPEPDLEINLSAGLDEQAIFDGAKTKVWRYQANLVHGDPASLQAIPNSYLGPVVRVKTGQRVRVNFTNELTEESIVHWHGLRVPAEMDGHPMYAVPPGGNYRYEFPVLNRAGTYWFHPHPDQLTGPQVYRGLAGLFIVSDDEESQAGLPSGDYDLPLVIQDRQVDANNQFVYLLSGNIDQMLGVLGDTILVNGQPDFVLPAEASVYRLRLLNGSNARIYKLAWEDGTPLTVIGTDGGLLEAPIQRPYAMVAPAERIELWLDLHARAVGSSLRLVSQSFDAGISGMMGSNGALANGASFPVLTVRVERAGTSASPALPQKLSSIPRFQATEAANQGSPRTFTLGMGMGGGGMMGRGGMGMNWTINGRSFEMKGVTRDEIVRLNTLELWQYDNSTNSSGGRGMMGGGMGGMLQMPHPMHIHGLQFQIQGWDVDPAAQSAWESVREGLITEGWKDTVLVMPGTRARLLLKFEDYTGLFLQHCHILEHEDLGMMRNYRVEG